MERDALKRSIDFIDSWLRYRYERSELPGFVVAIAQGDKLLFKRAYGYACLEKKEPMTVDHVFRIASHSKTFAATAIMQLQEADKLNIDEPVVRYIPWLKQHRDARLSKVTARQLMSHSAGVIRDGLDASYWHLKRPFPDQAAFKRELLKAELVFDNNRLMKYSNYGYTLLGCLIEEVSGMPFKRYAQEKIIKPLGLSNTGADYSDKTLPKLVTGYTRRDIEKKRHAIARDIDTNSMSAATGFYSTVSDMCKYFAAHFTGSGKLLDDESKKEMQRCQWRVTHSNENDEYGLGFAIDHVGTRRLLGHGGGFPGQITRTLFDPEDKLIVVVLTNCIDGEPKMIGKGILSVMDHFAKSAEQADSKTIGKLRPFQGRFVNLWGETDIVENGKTLIALNVNNWSPFGESQEVETLERVNVSTLRIKSANGYSSQGELVKYDFAPDGKVKSISYSGSPMLPEKEYYKSVAKAKSRRKNRRT